jgi:hypothetical protein|tara:strand:+ start:10799 stop:10960 length:162 start_codon:yes stop_codon:yes gene_type:complete
MKRAQKIIISEQLPQQTFFDQSVVQYWTEDQNGRINKDLLEKIKLLKQKTFEK